ncbi:MAG: DUF951 domain-containing protein, partial [Chloroflexota bacterium]
WNLLPADRSPAQFEVGDRVTLKKRHPCGSHVWTVYRVGADIGLRCTGCGRRTMMSRRETERRMTGRVPGDS